MEAFSISCTDMDNSGLGAFLVVDDDESLRTLLGVILESAGFEPIGVDTAEDALATLEKRNKAIQGVILDLNLKHSRGEDVLDRIQATNPDLVVFVISGCLSEEIQERLGDRPIDGILTKPFQASDLIRTVKRAVERQKELITSRESA